MTNSGDQKQLFIDSCTGLGLSVERANEVWEKAQAIAKNNKQPMPSFKDKIDNVDGNKLAKDIQSIEKVLADLKSLKK